MKRSLRYITPATRVLFLILTLLVVGCRRRTPKTPEPKKAAPKESSVGAQVVDGVTGRRAVRTFQGAKETIKDVEDAQKKRFEKIP